MIAQEHQQSKFSECVTPTFELVNDEETLSKVLQSHSWQVVKAEFYTTDTFLTRVTCTNCGLERVAILSNIKESADKVAKERRKSLPFLV
jgi:hypothetical protein